MPKVGLIACLLLILTSWIIFMHLAHVNGFKIGMLSVNNYYFYQDVFSKPWTKLHDIAFGTLLAHFYMDLLKYRALSQVQRKQQYPMVDFLCKSKFLGSLMLYSFLLLFLGNMTF